MMRNTRLTVALLCSAMCCSAAASNEVTGTVLDAATRVPIAGAYVVAVYDEWLASEAVSTFRCAKTKGMTTGTDGRFAFPVDPKLGVPNFVAIKSEYLFDGQDEPDPRGRKQRGMDPLKNRELYLKKQDEQNPDLFAYAVSSAICHNARTREDALAGAKYVRMVASEHRRYGGDPQRILSLERVARDLEGTAR
jgi:hypothetical protein